MFSSQAQQRLGCAGRGAALAAPQTGDHCKKLGDGVGTKCVGTGLLLLNRPVKEARGHAAIGWEEAALEDLREPQQGHGLGSPDKRSTAGADTNTPFLPICVVVKSNWRWR